MFNASDKSGIFIKSLRNKHETLFRQTVMKATVVETLHYEKLKI